MGAFGSRQSEGLPEAIAENTAAGGPPRKVRGIPPLTRRGAKRLRCVGVAHGRSSVLPCTG